MYAARKKTKFSWNRQTNPEEWLKEFLDDKGEFHRENHEENYNKNIEAVARRCSSK